MGSACSANSSIKVDPGTPLEKPVIHVVQNRSDDDIDKDDAPTSANAIVSEKPHEESLATAVMRADNETEGNLEASDVLDGSASPIGDVKPTTEHRAKEEDAKEEGVIETRNSRENRLVTLLSSEEVHTTPPATLNKCLKGAGQQVLHAFGNPKLAEKGKQSAEALCLSLTVLKGDALLLAVKQVEDVISGGIGFKDVGSLECFLQPLSDLLKDESILGPTLDSVIDALLGLCTNANIKRGIFPRIETLKNSKSLTWSRAVWLPAMSTLWKSAALSPEIDHLFLKEDGVASLLGWMTTEPAFKYGVMRLLKSIARLHDRFDVSCLQLCVRPLLSLLMTDESLPEKHKLEGILSTFWSLTNLPICCHEIIDAGGLPLLIRLCNSYADPEKQKYPLACLCNISSVEDLRQVLVDASVVALLVPLTFSHDPSIRLQSCWTVAQLACSSDPALRTYLASDKAAGALERITDIAITDVPVITPTFPIRISVALPRIFAMIDCKAFVEVRRFGVYCLYGVGRTKRPVKREMFRDRLCSPEIQNDRICLLLATQVFSEINFMCPRQLYSPGPEVPPTTLPSSTNTQELPSLALLQQHSPPPLPPDFAVAKNSSPPPQPTTSEGPSPLSLLSKSARKEQDTPTDDEKNGRSQRPVTEGYVQSSPLVLHQSSPMAAALKQQPLRPVVEMTEDDVCDWLDRVGLQELKEAFKANHIDGEMLLDLTPDDLASSELHIENRFVRKRLWRHVVSLTKNSNSPSVVAYVPPSQPQRTTNFSSSHGSGIHSVDASYARNYVPLSVIGTDNESGKAGNRSVETTRSLSTKTKTTTTSSAGPEVFISYRRSTGSELAVLIKVHLTLRGLNVFLDVDKLGLGRFTEALLENIAAAPSFVLVLSPGALDRCVADNEGKDWVHLEIATAIRLKKKIVPVMVKDFKYPPPESLPDDMREIGFQNAVQWVHAYHESCVDRLVKWLGYGTDGLVAQTQSHLPP